MRVLIVDDHKLLADALKAVLETHGDIDVVGSAGSGATARELAASLRPDVILMDQCLPDASGLELASSLRGSIPGVQVVMLSAIADEALAARAARAGCAAFLCKHQPLSDVVSALRAVGADGSQAPAVVQQNGRHPAGRLSKRESEVLELLAQGMGNKEIARELGLALNTVRNHVTRLLVKLGAHSRLEAVATAVRRRMIYR